MNFKFLVKKFYTRRLKIYANTKVVLGISQVRIMQIYYQIIVKLEELYRKILNLINLKHS